MTNAPPSLIVLALVIAGALAVLVHLYRRDQKARRQRRAGLFAPAYDLFQSYRVTQERSDFPVLAGRYRDRDFRIDTVIDTLTFRKLPVLWLRVSLLQPLPGVAATDILVRVQNNEFYAPANDLPYQLALPAHWPVGALAKTENPDRAPPLALLERHIDFLGGEAAKEMLVTAKGVRLVRMLHQGDRAEYLVLRVADFRGAALEPAMLADMMDRCIALADDLVGKAGSKS